jgi:hypothetical protein
MSGYANDVSGNGGDRDLVAAQAALESEGNAAVKIALAVNGNGQPYNTARMYRRWQTEWRVRRA